MNRYLVLSLIVLTSFIVCSCGLFGSGGGDDHDNTEYTLSVSLNPSEGGTVEPSSGTYQKGEQVTIEALPSQGWSFSSWSGDRESDANPISIEINSDIDLTANFSESSNKPEIYELSTKASPVEGGEVMPKDGSYEAGKKISVEANPDRGWKFTGWSGDLSGSENPEEVLMDRDKDILANFKRITSKFTVKVTYKDEIGRIDLQFGQEDNPELLSKEAPPPPPSGSFNAYFERDDGQKYLRDFRSATGIENSWKFKFSKGVGDSISLSWVVNPDSLKGNLTLTNSDSTLIINLKKDQKFPIPDSVDNTFFFNFSMK